MHPSSCACRAVFSATLLFSIFGCSDHLTIVHDAPGSGSHPQPPAKSTSTTLSVAEPHVTAGTPLQLIATVAPTEASGNVVFAEVTGAAAVRSDLAGGKASGQIATDISNVPAAPSLGIGTHTLKASYDGDANGAWSQSISAPVLVTVADPHAVCGLGLAEQAFAAGTTTLTGVTSAARGVTESAVCATNPETSVTLHNPVLSSIASIHPYEDVHGLGATVLAYAADSESNGASISLDGGTVTANGVASPAIFASGNGTTITVSGTTITELGGLGRLDGGASIPVGHAIAVARGGSVKLQQATVKNTANNDALLAIEGQGGTVLASDSTLNGQFVALVRGSGSITFANSALIASKGVSFGPDPTSTSTDQTASVQFQGGSFTYIGDFYSPAINASSGEIANISMDHVALQPTFSSGVGPVFLYAASSATQKTRVVFSAIKQTLTGNIVGGGASTVTISLTDQSQWTGRFDIYLVEIPTFNLSLDATSTWILTGDCQLTTLQDAAGISGTSITNIIGNGHTVTYDRSQNPSLAGKTYTLANGGSLKPAS